MHAETLTLLTPLGSARTVKTPAATMRTLTSPTSAPAMPVAIWRTDLPASATGPEHAIDTDQFVVVLSGTLDVRIADVDHRVAEGDGIKLPAGATRVIRSADGKPASTLTIGGADARATVGDNAPVPVPWTA